MVVGLWLAAAALAAPGLLRLHIDNSPQAFFIRGDPTLALHQRLARNLTTPAALRVAISGPSLWTEAGLAWLGELEADLVGVPGVLGAAGLAGLARAEGRSWPPADPEAARRSALEDPLPVNAGWMAPDGNTVTVLVLARHLPSSERAEMLRGIEALLRRAPSGIESWLTGLPAVSHALDAAMSRLARRLFPLVLLVTLLLLAAALGGSLDLLLPPALVTIGATVVFGLMGALRPTVDLVTVLTFPLLFVVGLAAAVHVQLRFRRLVQDGGMEPAAALERTCREKAWPILWTGVTTAVGFGSLLAARVPPVRALGGWCAFGIAVLTLALFTLQPALLALLPPPRAQATPYERWAARLGRALAARACARPGWVAVAFALTGALAALGTARLGVETNALGYLPADDPARAGLQELEARGLGAVGVDLALALPAAASRDGGFRETELRNRLAALAAGVRSQPGVLSALSHPDMEGRGGAGSELDLLQAGRGLLLSPDGDITRLRLLVPMRGYSDLDPVLAEALARARQLLPEAEAWVGGDYVLVLIAQRSLLATMVVSFTITAAIIAALLALLLRSARLTLAALVSNLWPVLMVVGVMGWLGVPVDGSTVAIAAVILGLAVDDTLHTLGYYRLQPGGATAIADTLERVAPAHVLTSAVLCAGFAVCAGAGLVPIARFGALTAIAIAAALAADLLLVPALLAGTDSAQRTLSR